MTQAEIGRLYPRSSSPVPAKFDPAMFTQIDCYATSGLGQDYSSGARYTKQARVTAALGKDGIMSLSGRMGAAPKLQL